METGTTLRENNLEEIAFIAEASARLIANRASFKLKFDRISKLVKALEWNWKGLMNKWKF